MIEGGTSFLVSLFFGTFCSITERVKVLMGESD